ncbi:MAG TPA: pyruvate formate lyase-activating protein [Firmicutes bacterium]|nr:pyruvate formate lyase-activating protein [Bacillota bacterium]HBM69959.1 pyruvate formate lyase-activating protein [Bacillota bacterium]
MSSQELATNTSNIFAYSDKLESFGLVDGPGVRSILFLSGCPLRCLYCHNPEMQSATCGKIITPEEAYQKLIKYKRYWGDKGGVTVSGGEPLNSIDFLIELGKILKKESISYVIDTSIATFSLEPTYLKKFDELLSLSSLFLLDLKALDPTLHKKITGKDNKNILEGYKYLKEKNFPVWIRYVLLPGYTDNEETLKSSSDFLKQFSNIKRVEILPYHSLALPKYEQLHRDYILKDVLPPSKEDIDKANKIMDVAYFDGYKKN